MVKLMGMSVDYQDAIRRGDIDKAVDLFNGEIFADKQVVGVYTGCAYLRGRELADKPHISNKDA